MSVVTTCVAVSLVSAPAQAQRGEPSPAELWEPIPLGPAESEQQPSRDAPGNDAQDRAEWPYLLVVLLITALAGVTSGVAFRVRQRHSATRAIRATRERRAAGDAADGGQALSAERSLGRLAALVAGMLALAGAEVAMALGHVLTAHIAYAILVVFLASAGRGSGKPEPAARFDAVAAAMRALAFIALIRVVGIGLPLRDIPEVAREGLLAIVIGIAALRVAPAIGVSFRKLLALPSRGIQWSTSVGGLALGLGAYLCGAPALVAPGDATGRVLLAVAAVTIAALVEEIVFRGLVQVSLQRLVGGLGGLAAPALFACSYISFGSVTLVLVITLAGLLFAHSLTASGVLGGAIVGHVLFAVGAGVAWPALFGLEPPASPPEPLAQLTLSAVVIIGAVMLARRSLWPVTRPLAIENGPASAPEQALVAERHPI